MPMSSENRELTLTDEEKEMYEGKMGSGTKKAIRILVSLAKIYGAKQLIPISSAQISGVSYKTIGDAGLEFIQDLPRDAKVRVHSTLNPVGMDTERWREMGIKENFAKKQLQIIEAYTRMEIEASMTCTPYYVGNRPKRGEHIAWSESSAVVFANSVLGAYTNREGGPSALAAAITGRTPEYGLHLPENRKGQVNIEIKAEKPLNFALLGNAVGRKVGGQIPYFTNLKDFDPSEDLLKHLGAAMAASGAVAMFHAGELTLEYREGYSPKASKITITEKELEETQRLLNTANGEIPDVIAVGCPHLSFEEIRSIALLLESMPAHRKKNLPGLWLFTSRGVKERAAEYVEIIEKYGMVIADTCMVVAPLDELFTTTATNSGKAAQYLPSFNSQRVVFLDIQTLLLRYL